jgi:hypothetical protein
MHVSGGRSFKFNLADFQSAYEPLKSGLVNSGLGTRDSQNQEKDRVSCEGDRMASLGLNKIVSFFLLFF